MVTQTAEIKEKYAAIMKQALDDSKAAGIHRVISVWYSAYFDNFILSAGYSAQLIDETNKLVVIPKDSHAVKLAAVCHNEKVIHGPPTDYLNKCVKFHNTYDETKSEEYSFMAQSFMKMADDFPVSLGDPLKNPIFWQKIADTALAKKAELNS